MPAQTSAATATKSARVGPSHTPFHWSLVTGIFVAWASWRYSEAIGDYTLKVHRWTACSSGAAGVPPDLGRGRFVHFAPVSPVLRAMDIVAYALSTLRGPARHYLGHNPLGSYMILALLAAVGLQATLGLFTVEHNDVTAGPLYRLVSEETREAISHWHGRWFYRAQLVLIPLHILANIGYGLIKKDPLIRAMITGASLPRDYVRCARGPRSRPMPTSRR